MHRIESTKEIDCDVGKFESRKTRFRIARTLHLPEADGIPELVGKVPSLLDLLLVETDILTLGGYPDDSEAQAIGTVFGDEIQGVG